MAKLNERQSRFCDEYIIDLNATQAAIRAGYSEDTAYSQGQRLLKKVEVKKRLREIMDEKDKTTIASQDEVLEYLTAVLRAEATGTTLVGIGQGAQEVRQLTPTVSERTKAAELLGKRYGLYVDKQQVSGSTQTVIVTGEDEMRRYLDERQDG